MVFNMLIALEGVDKSGKETQSKLLLERLLRENKKARIVNFPDYDSEAAGAVRMYLDGKFGDKPDDVNPYAASVFFAVDRYASFKTEWGAFYRAGGIVVADRYTMSNMIHQGAKIEDRAERRMYIDWLSDLEFNKIGLPEPDIVIFLDLAMDLRVLLMNEYTKNTDGRGADIHEKDLGYLRRSHECAREVAGLFGWMRIEAGRSGGLRPASDIHNEIYAAISPILPDNV